MAKILFSAVSLRSSLPCLRRLHCVSKVLRRDVDSNTLPVGMTPWLPMATRIPHQRCDSYRRLHTTPTVGIDVMLKDKQLVLVHDGKSTAINNLWLRDNCRCDVCYNHTTKQKNFDVTKLDLNVTAEGLQREGSELHIDWSDGHKSIHSLDFLNTQCLTDKTPSERRKLTKLWDTDTMTKCMPEAVDFTQYLTDDELLKMVLKNLLRYGIAFVKNVPPTIEDTKNVAERISFIKETFWGKHWLLTSDLKWADRAFTNERFNCHNDTTYLSEPAGAVIFHCVGHDGEGGMTLLVDAFNVAEKLKTKHPGYYDILTKFPVRHAKIIPDRKIHSVGEGHVLQLCPATGELRRVRHEPTSVCTRHSESKDLGLFYQALSTFTKELSSPENVLQLKLKPGLVCVVDNWRVLHGRTSFTGKRQMLGIYLPRDEIDSRYRTLLNLDI